jgi:ATP-dependent Clp protease adapter protein ClpS
MMSIHNGSFAAVGLYPKDIARTKVAIVTSMAREEGFPLKIEAIPE